MPSIAESTDWAHNTLSYAAQFDVTLSRLTPAILVETARSALRLFGGSVAKRTTNGTALTETTALSLPKYVSYRTAGGFQTAALSTTPLALSGLDQPWLLVWWGNQSHWCETTKPLNYSIATYAGSQGLHPRYAFQADTPILLVFSDIPASIVQSAGQGGFDLSWTSGAGKVVLLPISGRQRLVAATTEGWSSGLPSDVKATIDAWVPRLYQFPRTVAESYAYDSGSDTATVTETFTYTTVRAGGTRWAPLPTVLGVARSSSLPGLSVGGAVVDGGVPTEYGPTQGIEGVGGYSWTLSGLAPYTTPRAAPANGTVPSSLQARLDAEVDKLVSQTHWQPWLVGARIPNSQPGGDAYFTNPADTLVLASELIPTVSGTRRESLKAWLWAERTSYPPESIFNLSATAGTPRGPFGVPGTHVAYWSSGSPWVFQTRLTLWAAWGLARFYQETGDVAAPSVATALRSILDADMAEQDWATGHWFAGFGDRQTAVENANRHWAGLAGFAWIADQTGHPDEGLVRALLAKATVTRIAMAHLPRWQASVGLITLPTDLGSAAANAAWMPGSSTEWAGFVFTYDWTSADDDPRQVVKLDQFQAFLDDSKLRFGWMSGAVSNYAPPYRSFVQPLARLLAAAVGSEASIYVEKFREMQPHWWVPFADANLGAEANVQQPADSHGLFLARAWLEKVPAATLEREAAYAWLASGGDLFTAHKLAEAVRAYATEPAIPVPTVPPTPAYPPTATPVATSTPTPTSSPIGTPASTPTPTPSSATTPTPVARPRVDVRNVASETLQVTVTSSVQLVAIRVSETRNTKVSYAGQAGRTGAYTLSTPAGARSVTFTVTRHNPSGSGMVFFEIEDTAGRSTTFAGAGPAGWGG